MNGCKLIEFPEKLRRRRKEKKLTQKQLEIKAEIGKGVISFYETGVRRPALDTIAKLSKALGVKMRYFLEEY